MSSALLTRALIPGLNTAPLNGALALLAAGYFPLTAKNTNTCNYLTVRLHQMEEVSFKRVFAHRQINEVGTKCIFYGAQHIAGGTKRILNRY